MDPILPLAIALPPRASHDLLGALHRQLRAAILDGRLKAGLRLPATRALAGLLGISRNTAVAAYDLLLAEGYLEARRGSGTFVAERSAEPRRATDGSRSSTRIRINRAWCQEPALPCAATGVPPRFDFNLGLPDEGSFPFAIWHGLASRALRGLARAPVAYADPAGRPELREAIARHVSFARAVACTADDIVVTSGAQQAFDLIARILVSPRRPVVAMEDPGYPPLRAILAASGADVRPVPLDDDGILVDRIPAEAGLICVTPSHQFPLGTAMSPRRRIELLAFARAHDAVILEDDYDGEFRFDGRPLDALQTIDRSEAVVYVGTFSKSLFPALRLGFVVTPAWAQPALTAAKQLTDWHSPVLAQDTLAAFIAEGHLARHVRKMRRIYGERREALVRALDRQCGGAVMPLPGAAGLHLGALVDPAVDAEAWAARAAGQGIALNPLARYARSRPAPNGLTFGYGMIPRERIDQAIRSLVSAM